MSTTKPSSSQSGGVDPGSGNTLDRDVVLEVLGNDRRRFVVHYLKRQDGGPVPDGDVAERVAGWELDKPVEELDYKERKRVRNALRQFHFPKMEEAGFVEFDEREGTVSLSRAASKQDFYVDVLPSREIPWGVYYLGLSVLGLVCLVGFVLAVPPFPVIPTVGLFAGFVIALTLSSIGHFYDNYYRMRLGARETPPEVAER